MIKQPYYLHPLKKTAVGYLLNSSLCDCVGRLRVFEQLEDLLKSLLIWLPLHPEKHTIINPLINSVMYTFSSVPHCNFYRLPKLSANR